MFVKWKNHASSPTTILLVEIKNWSFYILCRNPVLAIRYKIPVKAWNDQRLDVDYLIIFWCIIVLIFQTKKGKIIREEKKMYFFLVLLRTHVNTKIYMELVLSAFKSLSIIFTHLLRLDNITLVLSSQLPSCIYIYFFIHMKCLSQLARTSTNSYGS